MAFTAITYSDFRMDPQYDGGVLRTLIFTEVATAAAGAETSFLFPSTTSSIQIKNLLVGKNYIVRYWNITAVTTGVVGVTPQLYLPGSAQLLNFDNYLTSAGISNEIVDTREVIYAMGESLSSRIANVATSALTIADAFQCFMAIEVVDDKPCSTCTHYSLFGGH